MRSWHCQVWIGLVPLLLAGCGAEDSGESANDPPVRVPTRAATEADSNKNASDAAAGPREVTIRGFRFQVPGGWKQVALSPEQQGMIDARFEIPSAGPDVSPCSPRLAATRRTTPGPSIPRRSTTSRR